MCRTPIGWQQWTVMVQLCCACMILLAVLDRTVEAKDRAAHTKELRPHDEAAQRRRATGLAGLLGIVAFLGVMLILLIVLWGGRTRRIARKPQPRPSAPDPLWYLKGQAAKSSDDSSTSESSDQDP